MISDVFEGLSREKWFDETFGTTCPDQREGGGLAGYDPAGYIYRRTWLQDAWPIERKLKGTDELTLFTLVEFLFDQVSKPVRTTGARYHEFGNCGYHYDKFDGSAGRLRWRTEVNDILQFYGEGFELDGTGHLRRIGQFGLRELLSAKLPKTADPTAVTTKVDHAVDKFRAGRSTLKDRQDAVRELADVLAFLRNDAQKFLERKDEADLFLVANNFAIRHNNDRQKRDYRAGWLSWMFYWYLSTIHLLLWLTNQSADGSKPAV
jgi:hypothetical protein